MRFSNCKEVVTLVNLDCNFLVIATLIQLIVENLQDEEAINNSKYDAKCRMEVDFINGSVPLDKMEEEPIAIVGMACRLPQSNDIEEFWNLLISKGDAITKIPEGRWLEEQVKTTKDKNQREECARVQAGFLKCPINEFDSKFFGLSPKEMEFTDPQQRLLLEVSWEALEDAAINPTSLQGTQTGIFTGTWTRDYADLMQKTGFEENEFFRSYIGNSYGATAGRE